MAEHLINRSELILNSDGSVFHLHLKKGDVAQRVILVGDPARADTVAAHFTRIEKRVTNREFVSVIGWYHQTRFTVVSTGIGQDNIDIVLGELDALVNIDFDTMTACKHLTSLTVVRIGTSGAVQNSLLQGDCVISRYSIGMDQLLHFYRSNETVRCLDLERSFIREMGIEATPLEGVYAVAADESLVALLKDIAIEGITLSAPGFYGPQGRWLRLQPIVTQMVERLSRFWYQEIPLTNIEMESSAVMGLSRLMGHKAITICLLIAQRIEGSGNSNYKEAMDQLVIDVLDRLSLQQ